MTHSKRILVAGGAGFLGINLCRLLLEEGHEVICLDDFSSGSRDNLNLVENCDRFQVLEQDVAAPHR